MSPIGRIFIVLNLALAAGFAVTAGNLLKNQDKYKKLYNAEQEARKSDLEAKDRQIQQLEQERNQFEVAKTSNESQYNAAKVRIAELEADNKRLENTTTEQAADLKGLHSLAQANDVRIKAALDQAKAAYDSSIAAGQAKDEAVRAKDSAEAENRTLKTTIASLEETISNKDMNIAALKRDNDEQKLLVAAAVANGFSPAMAAPNLAGTVTNVSGKLLTVAVADNPGNVDIQDQIERRPFRIAISDASGYKGEAVATKYEPSANAILCNLMFTRDGAPAIKTGDRASTK